MVTIGTTAAHFNAVWVKNEWSRFLALMKQDRSKLLLPCYRDMDPYDLPEALSVLQSYDMEKIGFIQDLIRGIKKVINAGKEPFTAKETVVVTQTAPIAVAPLLERAFMFLEDGKWEEADEYCEKVLDQEPKNAEAYLGKLMAELQVKTKGKLRNVKNPFDKNDNYIKACRFSTELSSELSDYNESAQANRNKELIRNKYEEAKQLMLSAETETDLQRASELFVSISGYNDSEKLSKECAGRKEDCRKNRIYKNTVNFLHNEAISVRDYEKAITNFQQILDWKDSKEQIEVCKMLIDKVNEEKDESEKKSKERKTVFRYFAVSFIIASIILVGILIVLNSEVFG